MEIKSTKTLHLVLKRKWYDMIASSEKTEEYRETSHYWQQRIWRKGFVPDTVTFHKGYTNKTMTFGIKTVKKGFGNPEWGAPTDKEVFIIKLGERLNNQ